MFLENKKKSDFSQKGFTLVEIMVVMAIVAMVSVLSVGGYLQYRKSTLLGLTADSIVSQLYAQRDNAIFGSYKSERAGEIRKELDGEIIDNKNVFDSRCFTVLFEKNAEDGKFSVYALQKKFSGQKKWFGDSWVYEGCTDIVGEKALFEIDSMVKIDNVFVGNFSGNGNGVQVSQTLDVDFLPPDGNMQVFLDKVFQSGDSTSSGATGSMPVFGMKIDISYGENSGNFKKSVFFDFVSGVGTVSK